ncbi:hypothetical protein Tco_0944788 [Tanacetum coccineum]
MNVTMNTSEHSSGSSSITADMVEFNDCINKIEVEDVCRSGLHFTWTKNLHKAKAGILTGVLKKLDRVMSNEEFIKQYLQARAIFLPYIISDHALVVLCIPSKMKRKIKAFKFSNFMTDQKEFLPIVKDQWDKEIKEFHIYKVVKKLKKLKSPLNKLGWNKGNLFKRVKDLRSRLQKVHTQFDADPHNIQLRDIEARLLEEFLEAEDHEEKFLFQQAKIQWLSKGDKNSKFFHKVLKGRIHRSRIFSLCNETGNTHKGDQIKHIFLRHFEDFLGKSQDVQDIYIKENLFHKMLSVAEAEYMMTYWLCVMSMFFGSVKDNIKIAIQQILPFGEGKLLVRYLGVPLITKRLGVKKGRLQLISAILESIHVYWSSVFLLPVTVINDINSLLKRFLWNQGESAKGKANVAWQNIYMPKSKGGLGLKDLQVWNEAMLAKHIWDIAHVATVFGRKEIQESSEMKEERVSNIVESKWPSEQVGLAGDLGSTDDVLIPLIHTVYSNPSNTAYRSPDTSAEIIENMKVIKEGFEKFGLLKINDDSFTCNTPLGAIFNEFNRLSGMNDDLFTYEEMDIREKDKKSSKNGQNQARNGKAWKRQSQIEAKVNKSQSQESQSQSQPGKVKGQI